MRVPVVMMLLAACFLAAPAAWADTYAIDPDHTTISFKIRHLFSNVTGTFDQFEGTIDYVPGKPELWKTSATMQAASINTHVSQRGAHES